MAVKSCIKCMDTLQINIRNGVVEYIPCRYNNFYKTTEDLTQAIASKKLMALTNNGCGDCEYRQDKNYDFDEANFNPTKIILGNTLNCNLNCYYCWRFVYKSKDAGWLENKDYLEQRFISKAKHLTWSMGEFYHDLEMQKQFLDYKQQYNLHLHVISNGVLYDPIIPVDSITLSLHGFNKESYINNCGKDVFEDIKKNIPLMGKKLTDINLVMSDYNRRYLENVIAFVENNIPKDVLIRVAYCQMDNRSTNNPKADCKIVFDTLKEKDYQVTFRSA